MSESAGITCSGLLVSRGNFSVAIATYLQTPVLAGRKGKGFEDRRAPSAASWHQLAPIGTRSDVPGRSSEPHRHPGTAFVRSRAQHSWFGINLGLMLELFTRNITALFQRGRAWLGAAPRRKCHTSPRLRVGDS